MNKYEIESKIKITVSITDEQLKEIEEVVVQDGDKEINRDYKHIMEEYKEHGLQEAVKLLLSEAVKQTLSEDGLDELVELKVFGEEDSPFVLNEFTTTAKKIP